MALGDLDHYTIRVPPRDLGRIRRFYVEVLGLEEGERPPFTFPGHWLYLAGRPVVHLAGREGMEAGAARGTGAIDHIAFRARGLREMRAHLNGLDVEFREQPVPGLGLHQIFLTDPAGILVEINYPAEEARGA
jgi:catechol 2,3-dioxygenase-like lactoylglutathione lyase family enzyme